MNEHQSQFEDHTMHQNCPPYFRKGDVFDNASAWFWAYWNGGIIRTQDVAYNHSVFAAILYDSEGGE